MKSSEAIAVRRLALADAAAWQSLRLRGLKEHPQAFTSSWEEDREQPLAHAERRLGASPERRFWGAFSGTQLVGIVGLEREQRSKNRHKATVVGLYVAPEFARRGIGCSLMTALLDDARASGIALLVLTVTRNNDNAALLYERLGFQSFGIEPGAIRVDGRAWDKQHMYLQLESP